MPLFSERLRTAFWQRGFATIERLPSLYRSRANTPKHLQTGSEGEEAGLFFLRREGLTVIAHGWQSERAPGDLDLVAWEGDVLSIVEVKTRSTRGMAAAEAAVDGAKRRSLRRLARHYLRQFPEGTLVRFDVLSIYFEGGATALERARRADYQFFRNAFGWQENELRSTAERLR